MKSVVMDANVVVSAALSSKGNPAKILEMLLHGDIENFTTEAIIKEIGGVLSRPRITKGILLSDSESMLLHFKEASIVNNPSESINEVNEDPTDDKILECAVEATADYIISGDDHLLKLKEFRGIKIVSPAEFVQLMGANNA